MNEGTSKDGDGERNRLEANCPFLMSTPFAFAFKDFQKAITAT
jgi:hypothetical protein